MSSIAALADRYGFAVLEDASHDWFVLSESAGWQLSPHAIVFSFHPVKIIIGEGGLATTNDHQLAQRMADLRSHGITKDEARFERPAPGPELRAARSGSQLPYDDLQAALGLSQLERLEIIAAERQRLLEQYRRRLAGLPCGYSRSPRRIQPFTWR